MIHLTQIAADKIQQQLKKRGHGLGIRIGVKSAGCSGFAYVLEYLDTVNINDRYFSSQDCNIYIDEKSYPFVQGTVIDYCRNGLNEGFEFRNPNERDRCGCGESFRI